MTDKPLPVNFTISEAAKAAMAHLKSIWPEMTGEDAGLMSIAWGEYHMNDGREFGRVIVSFYPPSYDAEVRAFADSVSGLEFLFFTTPKHWWRFSGKVLDHTPELSFHLR